MIAHVRGPVVGSTPESVVVDVGGVGYRCLVPTSTRSRLPGVGHEVLLHTSLQVREDSLTLFGFLSREEFDLFELLLRVDGIGPKVALGVLSAAAPEAVRRAIAFEDITALCRVPGIGKKTAQRLVLELKDKVGIVGSGAAVGGDSGAVGVDSLPGDAYSEAMEALGALGYSRAEAAEALVKAGREAGDEPDLSKLVRLSLKHLFRG